MPYQYKKKQYYAKKKKSVWRNRYFRWLIWLLLLTISLAYLVLVSPLFQIQSMQITVPPNMQTASFKAIASQTLAKNLFIAGLFHQETSNLLKEIPEVKSVEIKTIFPSSITVKIQPREPAARWGKELSDEQNYFFVDQAGILFAAAASTEPAQEPASSLSVATTTFPNLPVIMPAETDAELGQKALDQELISSIMRAFNGLEQELQLTVNYFTIDATRLTAKLASNAEIYFNPISNIDQQLFNLSALLEENDFFQNRTIKYIDLRFGNKVFYFAL